MPKLVCPRCEVEMGLATSGVHVIEWAEFGPYRLWEADEWECSSCGLKIIAGFANSPLEHYMPCFQEALRAALQSPDRVRHDFENQKQRQRFRKEICR